MVDDEDKARHNSALQNYFPVFLRAFAPLRELFL
jgi:hypothetical protein